MFPPPLAPGDPGLGALDVVDHTVGAGFVREGPGRIAIEPHDNPDPGASFGLVDPFFKVSPARGRRFQPATMVVALEPERLEGVARETLRLFRWSEEQEGFELVDESGLGHTRDYVWGRVREPGLYGLIGVNTNPLVARTLGLLAAMEDLTALGELGESEFLGGRICQLILCAPDFRERVGDPEFARAFVEGNLRLGLPVAWGPAGVPAEGWGASGDVCERCLGLGLGRPRIPGKVARPPELEILPKLCFPRPREIGRWDVLPLVPAPADTVLAVHAALLRSGKIVYFGGDENVEAQNRAGGAAIDNTRVFDPQSGSIAAVGSPPNYDLFCCGHALLPDGRLLAAGGTKQFPVPHQVHGGHFEGARDSAIFDPGAAVGANPWTAAPPLNRERGKTVGGGAWYPTLVTLPNGRVLRVAGHPEYGDSRHNNLMLESFDPATSTWLDEGAAADLPTTPFVDAPLYPRLHVLPDGHLFCATPLSGPFGGPSGESWKLNLATKAWASVGSGPGAEYGAYDVSSVLLPLVPAANYRARVLMTNRPQAKIIDLSAASPAWQPTGTRALAGTPVRYHATAVLLPDATVLVLGGHSDPNNWSPPELIAERFDPGPSTWSRLATAVVPRVYHSVALLLPDGRVWTAGSDYGGGNHEPRMEVYSPPYLFQGPRPTIAAAPATVAIAGSFTISSPEAHRIDTVCLMRCGSSTHAFNGDQRYVGLVIQSQASTQLTVAAPPSRNVAPPGYYLLFLVDKHGVPSVGRFVQVQ